MIKHFKNSASWIIQKLANVTVQYSTVYLDSTLTGLGHKKREGGGFCLVFLSWLNWPELDLWDQSQQFNDPKFLSKIKSPVCFPNIVYQI